MSRGKRLEIELKPRDRQQVEKLLGGGLQAVRTTLRALALRQMDQGQSTPAVGANLGLSAKAVWQIGKRYQPPAESKCGLFASITNCVALFNCSCVRTGTRMSEPSNEWVLWLLSPRPLSVLPRPLRLR